MSEYILKHDGEIVWSTSFKAVAIDEASRIRDAQGGLVQVLEMPGQHKVAEFGGLRLPPSKLKDLPRSTRNPSDAKDRELDEMNPLGRPRVSRKGGVQSHEDYAEFGTIYTTKRHRDPIDKDADQISFSHLGDALGKNDLIEADDILVPEHMGGSDYSGSSVTKANYDSFMEEFSEVPGVIALYGSYGSYGVGIRIHAINEEMVEILSKLQDYPIIDEEKMSEIEHEWEGEAWESWTRSDFLRALRNKFPQLEDEFDALDEDRDEQHDAVLDIFEAAREAANVYWESEHAGMHIRIDRVVAQVDEEDITERER